MYVLCVGMNRAASTWQYNVVSDLVECHHGGARLGFFQTGAQFAAHERSAGKRDGWHVLKAHDRHPVYAGALAAGRALAVYSYRDLRDLAYSLMHKCSADFDRVVLEDRYLHNCLDNDRFWTAQPRTLRQLYERIVADPVAAIGELAEHIRVTLDPGEALALAERYSLSANRQRAAELAQRLCADGVDLGDPANTLSYDEHTQLHWNHIRDGRPGAWREQTSPRERALLAGICGDWLIDRGYEADYRWAAGDLAEICRELGQAHVALREQQKQTAEQAARLAALEGLGPLARGVHRLTAMILRR
jgi:hypothetical protein